MFCGRITTNKKSSMKSLKTKIGRFFRLLVVPLLIIFFVGLGVISTIQYKHSLPNTIFLIQCICGIIIILSIYYWINLWIKLPPAKLFKIFHNFFRVIFTCWCGIIAFFIYWGVAPLGLAIFSFLSKGWRSKFSIVSYLVVGIAISYFNDFSVFFYYCGFLSVLLTGFYFLEKNSEEVFYFILYFLTTIICIASLAIPLLRGNLKFITNGVAKYVVFNHASFIDYVLLVLIMGYRQKWKVVIGVNLKKYWPFNRYIERVGIFLDREDPNSAEAVKHEMIAWIKKGYNVALFPAAGRDRPNEIRQFKGAFAVYAVRNQTQIVPVAMHDTGKYCPAGPRSENSKGELPSKFWLLCSYRFAALVKILKLLFSGKGNHLLISPRILKIHVLPTISLNGINGSTKGPKEIVSETHYVIHKDLGNVK